MAPKDQRHALLLLWGCGLGGDISANVQIQAEGLPTNGAGYFDPVTQVSTALNSTRGFLSLATVDSYFLTGRYLFTDIMKFMADGMLGKLTRWLRLAGYDVAYVGDLKLPPERQDDELIARAKSVKRMLLTSDLALYKRARKADVKTLLVTSDDVVSQLAEVSKRIRHIIEITPESSRCPVCNGLLVLVNRAEIIGLVPATVIKTHNEFWRCTKCKKIYWLGTHWKTIIDMASRYTKIMK